MTFSSFITIFFTIDRLGHPSALEGLKNEPKLNSFTCDQKPFFSPKMLRCTSSGRLHATYLVGGGPNKSKFFIVFPGFNRGEGCVTRVVPLSQAPMIHIYPRQTFDNAESISRKTGLSSALV